MQTDGFEYLKVSCPSVITELLEYVAKISEHCRSSFTYGNETNMLDGGDMNGRRVKQRLYWIHNVKVELEFVQHNKIRLLDILNKRVLLLRRLVDLIILDWSHMSSSLYPPPLFSFLHVKHICSFWAEVLMLVVLWNVGTGRHVSWIWWM